MRGIDREAKHEAEEADIGALLRKIESLEAGMERKLAGKAPGDPSVPGDLTHRQKPESGNQVRLGRFFGVQEQARRRVVRPCLG